jgi:two-component system nitrate/nitrite response regulator NarL
MRVHIAEEDPVYREGLVGSMRDRPGLDQITQSNERDAVERISELEPDVAVLGVKPASDDGIGVLKRLRESQVATRVLVLSAYSDGAFTYEALQAGAAGCLLKGSDSREIWSALLAAEAGKPVLSPGVGQGLMRQICGANDAVAPEPSSREREILRLMANGLSNAAIGRRLHISEGTVKTYVRRAYAKLEVSTRAAAIAQAMRLGILH